jgi:Ca2+-transporting ATPase
MSKNPRNPEERILKKRNLILIVSIAAIMALASFIVFILNNPEVDIGKARTLTFAAIVTMILFIPFAFRSLEEPIYKIGILKNKLLMVGVSATFLLTLGVLYIPFFQTIFEFTTLSPADWVIPLSAALVSLIFAEFIKMITRNR